MFLASRNNSNDIIVDFTKIEDMVDTSTYLYVYTYNILYTEALKFNLTMLRLIFYNFCYLLANMTISCTLHALCCML